MRQVTSANLILCLISYSVGPRIVATVNQSSGPLESQQPISLAPRSLPSPSTLVLNVPCSPRVPSGTTLAKHLPDEKYLASESGVYHILIRFHEKASKSYTLN
jgi:hypothetical protein